MPAKAASYGAAFAGREAIFQRLRETGNPSGLFGKKRTKGLQNTQKNRKNSCNGNRFMVHLT